MEKNNGSRLLQMQARFHQRQLEERELRIASLYETQQARALDRLRGASVADPPADPPTHHAGKVRQMFEERRTKAGIDKSYPLQPIQNQERAAHRRVNGHKPITKPTVEKLTKHTTKPHVEGRIDQKNSQMMNGHGELNQCREPDLRALKQALPQVPAKDEGDGYLLEHETFPEALAMDTPRSPPAPIAPPSRPPRKSPTSKVNSLKTKKTEAAVAPQRKSETDVSMPPVRLKPRPVVMQKKSQPVTKKPLALGATSGTISVASPSGKASGTGLGAGAGGDACGVCGRRFAADRLAKHEEICRRASTKTRKPFDALKHRLQGTEAEPFIGKLRKGNTSKPAPTAAKPINSSWRQKHQEFIQAIRAAKQVQAHLNAGGKLSDLPPPPPSENPDYVPCPHCGRRFNRTAAERHIPKCATYQFNKPKAAPARRR